MGPRLPYKHELSTDLFRDVRAIFKRPGRSDPNGGRLPVLLPADFVGLAELSGGFSSLAISLCSKLM